MLRAILAQEVAVKGVVITSEKRLLPTIAALRDMMTGMTMRARNAIIGA